MNSDNEDYYRILGVLDDAEDVVVKAAYRALAQRYHPDRWHGGAAEATRRMAKINAAYEVLSDSKKRSAYDSQRDKSQFRADDFDDATNNGNSETSAIDRDWEIAKTYHPEITEVERGLRKLSNPLGFTFKLTLLENKRFSDCHKVAIELEQGYLRKYFGNQADVHYFAKELLLAGQRDAAKELNDAVRVLGIIGVEVIDKIAQKFKINDKRRNRRQVANKIVLSFQDQLPANEIRQLIQDYRLRFNPSIQAEFVHSDGPFRVRHDLEIYLDNGLTGRRRLSKSQFLEWLDQDSQG